MTRCEIFSAFVESRGASTEIIQPDDGSGYTVLMLSIPGVGDIEVTVHE